ncbi:MAG TPA: PilZ domain-containing protein [Allosphingosinicella sp.]|jgi:hypothetical protein
MALSVKREPRFKARRPRAATFITTAVLLPDDREIRVDVRNISPEGFMAVTNVDDLAIGTQFGISIPGRGIVRAEVRWSDGGAFGARFSAPLELQTATD